MIITVIIPTYKRPKELARCLEALRAQERKADEVIVIARDSDEEALAYLQDAAGSSPGLRKVIVNRPGQVAALNTGLDNARGDIIAITDDDCVPHLDWLAKIEAHFKANPKAGGVGGKDVVFIEGKEVLSHRCQVPGVRCQVGKITWYGKIIGNSHLGSGEAREVDHLKGANMAFRREALEGIQFDERLKGEGAQYRNDLGVCLAVKKMGWKIIYDPQVLVEHFYAERFENDKRGNFDLTAIKDGAFNETYVVSKYLKGFKKCLVLFYAFMVGDLFLPGLAQLLRILLTRGKQPWARFRAAAQGRRYALCAMRYAPCSMPQVKYRIAFLISHPVQYFSPLFAQLAKEPGIGLTVFYCSDEGANQMRDPGFNKSIKWDIPLLEGYKYKFLKNNSLFPTVSHTPFGLVNFGIIKELFKGKYDAIIIHGWHYVTYWLAIIAAQLSKTPVFLHAEAPLNQELLKSKWKIALKRVFLGFLFKHVAGFLAIGSENQKFYEFYGARKEKISFMPYAVDNGRFIKECQELTGKKAELRQRLGISADKAVILFAGKLIPKKRPMDLLLAYEKINYENKALIFAGDGLLRAGLEKYVNEKKVPGVYFLGFKNQTEISECYSMADVFVLPSGIGETWGLVVNEAMCFGLPVILTHLCGCGADLVRHGENGFIFQAGNVRELAGYLEEFFRDKGKILSFGEKSYESIQSWGYKADIEGLIAGLRKH